MILFVSELSNLSGEGDEISLNYFTYLVGVFGIGISSKTKSSSGNFDFKLLITKSIATVLLRPCGIIMSAYFMVGLMNFSYEVLTNLLYYTSTFSIFLPLSVISLYNLLANLMSSSVITKIFKSIRSLNRFSYSAKIPSKITIG